MKLLVEQTNNLANFYLLPFIKRSNKDFSAGVFINSYLDIETFSIVVEVEAMYEHYKEFSHYDFTLEKGSRVFIFYELPEVFHNDVGQFVDGKYSRFSDMAKTYIRKFGKLPIKSNAKGEITQSVWLHVIERTAKLRETLQYELGETIEEYDELASKPNENNFFHNI
jgi:hypothetical protein